MRLHSLSLTAFGPFAEPLAIDFDALSSEGLFLLSGPTGAGKSSVLDAVCFALFGRVAGERNQAGRLTSDHADPSVRPLVELECTIGAARLRIVRSPEWVRPKRRGSGTTKQQSSVVVQELRVDQWTTLSTRLDEAGDLIGRRLGVTLDQFLQVAMLPQGGFQTFLTAKADERKQLLEKLFRTDSYLKIEQQFVSRRRAAAADVEDALADLREHVARFAEASGMHDFRDPVTAEDVLSPDLINWADDVVTQCEATASLAIVHEQQSRASAQAHSDQLIAARRLHLLQERGKASQSEFDALQHRAPIAASWAERISSAHRAAPVIPVLEVHALSSKRLEAAEINLRQALASVAEVLEVPADPDALRLGHTRALQQQALAEEFVPSHLRLSQLRDNFERLTGQAQELERTIEQQAHHLAQAPVKIEQLSSECERLSALIVDKVAHDREVAAVLSAIERCNQLAQAARDLAQISALTTAAAASESVLKEAWLAAKEARIAGMAAELATQLAVGADCPVCGSAEHPHLASRTAHHVDATAEDEARSRLDDAVITHQSHREGEAAARMQVTALTQSLVGIRTESLQGNLDQLLRIGSTSDEARAALETAQHDLSAQQASHDALNLKHTADAQALALTQQRLAAVAEEIGALTSSLQRLLAGRAEAEFDDLVGNFQHQARLFAAAIDALDHHRSCQVEARRDLQRLKVALDAAGFDSPTHAKEAHLGVEALASQQQQLDDFNDALAAATAALKDPEVRHALSEPDPDLQQLEAAEVELNQQFVQAAATASTSAKIHERVAALQAQLRDAIDQFRPLHEAWVVVEELSEVLEGKGRHNPARISLSAYVLAQRLRHVVDAANLRLGPMIDHRFRLEHTEQRGARERQGGLGLRVVDEWTDTVRPPESLSGGETFVVSLALALGLADVVTHEAGGVEIGTLFVDEGFGSLDPETLDQVLDVLDLLRNGGRVVGIVSHVAEIRQRVPMRLEVVKGRNGSSVRLASASGHCG